MHTFLRLPWLLASVATLALFGCDSEVQCEDGACPGGGGAGAGGGSGGSGGSGGEGGQGATAPTKLDVLFVVDNSFGMAEHQAALASSVQTLLSTLTSPPCVDLAGTAVDWPVSPTAACPSGSSRRHRPLTDLHIGVISSSLGALTGSQCDGQPAPSVGANDAAHLLDRGPAGTVPTYEGQGFLAFDAAGVMTPPGEADLAVVASRLSDLIVGAGSTGCGYEMPLEAMVRFLVDPDPYESLEPGAGGLPARVGTDSALLTQREAFLRPDSAVAIVLLSNENDCSMNVASQGPLLFDPEPFFRSTSACQTDPNGPCCTSCGLPLPDGCAPDPTCDQPLYSLIEDHPNLRCYDQKRRYGVDFLYPTARFVNALSNATIDPAASDLGGASASTPNPLFAGGRSPSNVVLLSLVGVPWQDLASDPNSGDSALLASEEVVWEYLTGYDDVFMIESILGRNGANPVTGDSTGAGNPINGGDRGIPLNDALQYACIRPLLVPITSSPACEPCAADPSCDDPMCDGATQVATVATPGRRHNGVVQGLGDRGVPATICPGDLGVPFETAYEALSRRLGSSLAK